MSEQNVSLWEKWKVQVAFVAGALVVSSVWGSCSYAPSETVAEEKVQESAAPAETVATPEETTAPTAEGSTEAASTGEVIPVPTTEATATTSATVTPTTSK